MVGPPAYSHVTDDDSDTAMETKDSHSHATHLTDPVVANGHSQVLFLDFRIDVYMW